MTTSPPRPQHRRDALKGGTLERPEHGDAGATKAKLPLSERTFRCEHCGVLDRDVNAARNLAAPAKRVAASDAETETRGRQPR